MKTDELSFDMDDISADGSDEQITVPGVAPTTSGGEPNRAPVEPKAEPEDPKGDSSLAAAMENLTFREASEELEGIVRLLESNQLELEDALQSYERGVYLLRELQTRLAGAQQQVTVLMGELEPESSDDIDTTLS